MSRALVGEMPGEGKSAALVTDRPALTRRTAASLPVEAG